MELRMLEQPRSPHRFAFLILACGIGLAGCPSPHEDDPARDTDTLTGGTSSTSEDDTTSGTQAPNTTVDPSAPTDDEVTTDTTALTENSESTSTSEPESTGSSSGEPGPECGDGIMDPELGEECAGLWTYLDGDIGIKNCSLEFRLYCMEQ